MALKNAPGFHLNPDFFKKKSIFPFPACFVVSHHFTSHISTAGIYVLARGHNGHTRRHKLYMLALRDHSMLQDRTNGKKRHKLLKYKTIVV